MSKYHKPLDETIQESIPFSQPSVRSVKSNSRFPSIKHALSAKQKAMEEDENLYSKANNTLRLGILLIYVVLII